MSHNKPTATLIYTPRRKTRSHGLDGRIKTEIVPAFIVAGPDGTRSAVMNRNETRTFCKVRGWAIAKDIL